MTGGARESTYFLTVFLEIPSSLAMPRRETPCSLAWCTAFHRACLRGVASLGADRGMYFILRLTQLIVRPDSR